MSHEKDSSYKYPVVYSVNKQDQLTFKWSKRTDKGMFGIPKVIFGSGATGFVKDTEGLYGLTQWATGIVYEPKNQEKISIVLKSDAFFNIIKAISVGKAEINRKILKYFNKNFYDILAADS